MNATAGSTLLRTLAALLLCGAAAPALAQPVYVTGTIGTSTTLIAHTTYDGFDDPDEDTAVTLAGRVGLNIGPRWGVELEIARALEVEQEPDARILPVSRAATLGVVYPYFIGETETTRTTISPVAWVSHSLTSRVELAFLAGISLERTVTEQEFEPPFLAPAVPVTAVTSLPNVRPGLVDASLSILPRDVTTVQYDRGVVAGVDARIAVGEHLRLVPSFRMQAMSGAWALRPSVGVGWTF
jgi:hypothetical protein